MLFKSPSLWFNKSPIKTQWSGTLLKNRKRRNSNQKNRKLQESNPKVKKVYHQEREITTDLGYNHYLRRQRVKKMKIKNIKANFFTLFIQMEKGLIQI